MYGCCTTRRKALRYRGLGFQTLGSAINATGMNLTGSQSQIHLSVVHGGHREHLFVCLFVCLFVFITFKT